mmetsp:Transcript_54431/g.126959  ORF Transcript_54431/g.126959 Transcript_54431/m.126959 type:complete len:322 (-) Transcript_54431:114-1079(-)
MLRVRPDSVEIHARPHPEIEGVALSTLVLDDALPQPAETSLQVGCWHHNAIAIFLLEALFLTFLDGKAVAKGVFAVERFCSVVLPAIHAIEPLPLSPARGCSGGAGGSRRVRWLRGVLETDRIVILGRGPDSFCPDFARAGADEADALAGMVLETGGFALLEAARHAGGEVACLLVSGMCAAAAPAMATVHGHKILKGRHVMQQPHASGPWCMNALADALGPDLATVSCKANSLTRGLGQTAILAILQTPFYMGFCGSVAWFPKPGALSVNSAMDREELRLFASTSCMFHRTFELQPRLSSAAGAFPPRTASVHGRRGLRK